jgi:DinB family protein
MSFVSVTTSRARAPRLLALLTAILALGMLATPARAQDAFTKESAAAVKTAFLGDLEVMRGKFVGLAQAFPPDKYTWRPMDGVRSVSEVLMLIASEGYGFVPTGFGGKAALPREEMTKLSAITDKTQVIDHLNKAFAHAKKELEAADPSTLIAKRRVMGQDRSVVEIALAIGGDMHEHLGQLIAYARTNHIVPPWSK